MLRLSLPHPFLLSQTRQTQDPMQPAQMKVKVKDMHSGELGWMPFLTAIELWVNRKGIEIAREPDLAEYESDEEREQGLRIVRGIYDRLSENPKTEYTWRKEELDALETVTMKDIIEMGEPRIEKQHLLNLLQAKHPINDRDTIRRRVDSIVEKGHLDRIKVGTVTYYALKASPYYKREKVLTA